MREEIELMRIVRVPPMGRLVIEVGNHRYETLSEINDERLKRRIITAIGELMGLAGGYQALVDADVAPPLSAKTPSGGLQQKAASLKEQQERFLERLEQEKERLASSSSQPPAAPSPPAITPDTPAQSLSIVEQIDEILQANKSQLPQFQNRSIHLVQGVEGNVQIEVDGEIFNRPKDISDKLIQRLIKTSIKEWESN